MTAETTTGEPTTVWIGLDWAAEWHQWDLESTDHRRAEGRVANHPDAILEWLDGLASTFPGAALRILLERKSGALVHWLAAHPRAEVYVVHPLSLKNYRRAQRPSGAKDDPHDALLLREYLRLHAANTERVLPGKDDYAVLGKLVWERRRLVNARTRVVNQLRAELGFAFPQITGWFEDLTGPAVARLLVRWPGLELLQSAPATTVGRFLKSEFGWDAERTKTWREELRKSHCSIASAKLVRASALLVEALAKQLESLSESITCFDKEIHALAREQEDYAIFSSFTGAGPALTPRLMTLFGTDRNAWESASNLQRRTGVAPITQASGHSKRVSARVACPKFLRQTMVEFARCSIRKSVWAREYYDERLAKGMGKPAIFRALAYKWLRILFRCWKERLHYDEELYLARRQQRHQQTQNHAVTRTKRPVRPSGNSGVEIRWISCGDFQKLSIE